MTNQVGKAEGDGGEGGESARLPLAGSAAILCTGGPDVIRKEAWSFYRTISGVRLWWELEEPEGPKGHDRDQKIKEESRPVWGVGGAHP